MASQATLIGTVAGFPANVETNVAQPVTFTFANHGSADATINSTTLTFPKSVGTVTNQCTDNLVLAPGQACTISGSLQNAPSGSITWTATVNYRGGPANANVDVAQNTSTNVGDTVVTGNVVTEVPAHVTTNMARNFIFRFTFSGCLLCSGGWGFSPVEW